MPDNVENFSETVRHLWDMMNPCRICPRNCGISRSKGEIDFCGIGEQVKVSSAGPHFGEEPELVGPGGSGTIFFAAVIWGVFFVRISILAITAAGRKRVLRN